MNYPHKGIKVQVSSILASILKNSEHVKNMQKTPENEFLIDNVKELNSSNCSHTFHHILVELINQNLGGLTNESYNKLIDENSPFLQDELNSFTQILDTVLKLVSLPKSQKKFQQICRQIGMVERLWSSWKVNPSKVAETFTQLVY